VLYNFLVEFSRFDWDHYCLSLLGPVPIKDLTKSAAQGKEWGLRCLWHMQQQQDP
jgi:hypothetical protein